MKLGSGSNNLINAGMFGAYKTGLDNKIKNENVGGGYTPTVTSNTNTSTIANTEEYKNLVNQKRSALSTANAANRVAMKYADNAALAQGYATQGAALQNVANIQNAYQNQVGGINQQFQQQLGELKDTKSAESLENFYQMIQNAVANGSLTEESGKKMLEQSGGLMNQSDSNLAQAYLQQGIASQTQAQQDKQNSEAEIFGNTLMNSYGEITPEQNEILKKVQSGELSLYDAYALVSQNQKQEEQQTQQENPTNEKGNPIFTTENKSEYTTNANEKAGWHKDFDVTIGTKGYKFEYGKKVVDSNFDPESIKVGEITTYKTNGLTYLVTKDKNGDIRYVKNRVGSLVAIDGNDASKVTDTDNELFELAKALGFNPRSEYDRRNGGGR